MTHLLPPQLVEVLSRTCAGQTEAAIARALGLTVGTVVTRQAQIRRRLGRAPFAEICRALAEHGAAALPRLIAERVRSPQSGQETEVRIEHHDDDGGVRLLGSSTVASVAIASARRWATLLRRQGKTGAVVVVDRRTGASSYVAPIKS